MDNTDSKFTTVDEYLKNLSKDTRDIVNKVRQTISKTIPEATEVISYGIPCFKLNGQYVVYVSGWKQHYSIYPLPKSDKNLQKDMEPFIAGKGTLKFPLDKPIPHDLIKRVVIALAKDNSQRTKS